MSWRVFFTGTHYSGFTPYPQVGAADNIHGNYVYGPVGTAGPVAAGTGTTYDLYWATGDTSTGTADPTGTPVTLSAISGVGTVSAVLSNTAYVYFTNSSVTYVVGQASSTVVATLDFYAGSSGTDNVCLDDSYFVQSFFIPPTTTSTPMVGVADAATSSVIGSALVPWPGHHNVALALNPVSGIAYVYVPSSASILDVALLDCASVTFTDTLDVGSDLGPDEVITDVGYSGDGSQIIVVKKAQVLF